MTTKKELKEFEQEYIRNGLLRALGQKGKEIALTDLIDNYRSYIRDTSGTKNEIATEIELRRLFTTSVANSQGLLLVLKSHDLATKHGTTDAVIQMLDFRLKILNDQTPSKEEAETVTETIIQALSLEKAFSTASYLFLNILGLGVKQEELSKQKLTIRTKDINSLIKDLKKIDKKLAKKLAYSLWLYENYCFDIPYIVEMNIEDTTRREIKKEDLEKAEENETFEKMVATLQNDFYEILPRLKGVLDDEEARA